MTSVTKALELVEQNTSILSKTIQIRLDYARDYILARDVFSPISMPPFRQSAMDGYALNMGDGTLYRCVGEVQAGAFLDLKLKQGEAVRIFTGAAVPDTANAVIMQEHVIVDGDTINITSPISEGTNIRPLGEQVSCGAIALPTKTKLTPMAIGYLFGLGITEVTVFDKPSIAVVVTGNELVEAGQELSLGKIYESNSKMLRHLLEKEGYKKVSIHQVKDDYQRVKALLDRLISTHDLVIVSGGISVGDYDFVGKALKKIGVKDFFCRVRQKPGKPLFFGKKKETIVFGLPGNPAASVVCFYVYVYVALLKLSGSNNRSLVRITVKSLSDYEKQGNRVHFLKAKISLNGVSILKNQSSAMLNTFAIANALVYVPESVFNIKKGDLVEVYCLPI